MLLAACSKELPPRPLSDFEDDPILLEATIVRCSQDRAATKYEADCINAREVAKRHAGTEDDARRKQLEAQSERKRRALRRAQEAASEARRRAAEARRLREDAEYLGQFETLPGDSAGAPLSDVGSNAPGALIVPPDEAGKLPLPDQAGEPPLPDQAGEPPLPDQAGEPPLPDQAGEPPLPDPAGEPPLPDPAGEPPLPDQAGEPPLPDEAAEPAIAGTDDLDAVREELQRRQEDSR